MLNSPPQVPPKTSLLSDVQLAFAKELISLSQEMQQLEAQLERTVNQFLVPETDLHEDMGTDFTMKLGIHMEGVRQKLSDARGEYKRLAKKLLKLKGIKV